MAHTQTVRLTKISPATSTAVTLGDSGDTFTVPTGVTLDASSGDITMPATVTVSTELKTNKISPGSGTAFTFGDSGDTFTIPSGATMVNSGTATGFGSVVKISEQSFTNQATVEFTSGIDSTYREYVFRFYDIDIVTDQTTWSFQVNAVGQSGFNETIQSTWYYAALDEAAGGQFFQYQTSHDQAQGTGYHSLAKSNQADADASIVGELHLFNPSSTTYVKNFYSRAHYMGASTVRYTEDSFSAGYINTTAAIDEISFKAISGNFSGTIKMYGLK